MAHVCMNLTVFSLIACGESFTLHDVADFLIS